MKRELVYSILLYIGIVSVVLVMLTNCTAVVATLPDNTTVEVITFAQSRQDIDIGKDENGAVYWKASNSSPDQTLAKAIADLAGIVAAAPK